MARASPTSNQPAADAAIVARLRELGALVMGKTVTTEFACRHAGPTVNPHNFAHTPGGFSSGSAAAVADFQIPIGTGTQTAGSVIRPAALPAGRGPQQLPLGVQLVGARRQDERLLTWAAWSQSTLRAA